MQLSAAQETTLKNHITANTNTATNPATQATFVINEHTDPDAPNGADFMQGIANWYSGLASPSYFGLKISLGRRFFIEETGIDTDGNTVTAFVGGGAQAGNYISRSQGERDAFDRVFFDSSNMCNPSKANIRTMFDDIFSGNGAAAILNRAHFRAVSRRSLSNLEKLFAVATAGGPTQTGNRGAATNPDTLGVDELGVAIQGSVNGSFIENVIRNG